MTERENCVIFTGFCILIVLSVSIAACISPNPGTDIPVTAPAQPVQAVTVTASEITDPATTTVQAIQPADVTGKAQIPEPQPDEPVSITINSARKQLGLGEWGEVYTEPVPGNVYLVLDISVKNNDAPDGFVFSNSSLTVQDPDRGTVTNRPFRLRQSLRKYVEHPFRLPTMVNQGDTVTGQILFEINDSVNYRVNLVDSDKTVLASRPVSFDDLLTDDAPVSITIHDARKVREFNSSMPHPGSPNPGHIFLILNVTIKNNDIREGYVFDFTSTHLQDLRNGHYERQSLNNGVNIIKNLENPIIVPTTIKQNGTKTGQLLFGVGDSTDYRLNLIGTNKTVIGSTYIHVG